MTDQNRIVSLRNAGWIASGEGRGSANVGTTTPDQYPDAQAKDASGSGRIAGRDDEIENERLNPGSGHGGTPSAADAPERDQFNGGEA